MFEQFSHSNYHSICDQLAAGDPDLALIIQNHGYPPLWSRPNSFETLVHIILEQQVSLASALSALNKLRERVQEITPARVLLLTDEEFKACYCSRQKTAYIKYLAEAIISGQIDLEAMEQMPDDVIRAKLMALKGIGNWTVDVYLMFVLQHTDVFPIGDLAAVNALKRVKKSAKGYYKGRFVGGNRTVETIPHHSGYDIVALLFEPKDISFTQTLPGRPGKIKYLRVRV